MMTAQSARMLIVDDEGPLMAALCNTLKDEGYVTAGVTSGHAALQALKKNKFDLLLADIAMPEMDGTALLRSALALDPALACVMMTTEATLATALRSLSLGAMDYVIKPLKLPVMLPVLSHALTIRRLRSENAALQERLHARTADFEAAVKELETFCYSVSHDLRAPLRHIGGYTELIAESATQKLDLKEQRHLGKIVSSANLMTKLIDDLLRLSRIGRQHIDRQPIHVGRMVKQIVSDLHAADPEREIEVRIGELPDCSGDAALLKEMFMHLVSNAFKFTRDRSKAKIEIGSTRHGAEIVYFIRDNGAGFSMSNSERLFGIFQRLHPSDQFEGTGAGLAIVRRILQRHNGRIWADAQTDKGATFYFTVGD